MARYPPPICRVANPTYSVTTIKCSATISERETRFFVQAQRQNPVSDPAKEVSCILLFFFSQCIFTQGVVISGVKG